VILQKIVPLSEQNGIEENKGCFDMRVVHIIPTLESGGAEKMLIDLLEEMKKSEVTIEVFVLSDKGDFYSKKLQDLDITIHFSPINIVYHPLQILVIKQFLNNNFDIVHAHLFAPQLYIAISKIIKFGFKSTLITTEHSTHNRRREKKYFKVLDNWMYKKYSKIIANTEGTKKELNKYLPNTTAKTIVVQNGIQVGEYINAKPLKRAELIKNYRENDILIVMVAAMREQKDHETLIRASKLLPENYHILFVGAGERINNVKEYAENYGENIHFLGRRSDVPSILKACDIFVLSSKWEGFALVAIEAMAAGLPVIVSDVVGMKEVVDGVGKLFEVGNENELAKQILSIKLKTLKGQDFIGLKNEKYLLYNIETVSSNYLRVYHEAILNYE